MRSGALYVIAMLLVPCASASAQESLITGFGGPLDFGTMSPPRGDDGSTLSAVPLGAAFPTGVDFFGQHFTDVWVNINGSLSFGMAEMHFSPTSFPRPAGSPPMIAAWWADVDTRPIIATEPDANQVYYASSATQFVATWIDVG